MISQKQVKLYQYLYIEEDLAILGAYEVFLMNGELQDFVENLVVIDKYYYFKAKLVIFLLFSRFQTSFLGFG